MLKYFDRMLVFGLGALVAVASMLVLGTWRYGDSSVRETEALRSRVAELENSIRTAEAARAAAVEQRRRLAEQRAAEAALKLEEAREAMGRRGASFSDDRGESIFRSGFAVEQGGKAGDAVRIYRRAARAGSGQAARRLGEMYRCGIAGPAGVPRNYAESLQWYETASRLGEKNLPTPSRDGAGC